MPEIRIVFLILLLIELLTGVMSSYQTFYAGIACKRSGHLAIKVGSSGQNSSGILTSSESGAFIPGMNCSIVISPPGQYGVVASIRFLDLKPEGKCDNHLKIFTDPVQYVKLCGFNSDVTEQQSYTSVGEMIMWFHTTNESTLFPGEQISQFELTFTSVRKGSGHCRNDQQRCENDYCVWKGLFCDGHNNCGDQSDENKHSIANCNKPSRTFILTIVALTIASLAFIVILIYTMQDRITRRIERLCGSYAHMPSETIAISRVPLNEYYSTSTTPVHTTVSISLPCNSNGGSRKMDIQRGNDLLTHTDCIQPNRVSKFSDSPPCNHPPLYT